MNPWVEKLGLPALISTLVSALVGGVVAFYSADSIDKTSKVRATRLEQIVRFSSVNDDIYSGVNSLIVSMASGKDAADARINLSTSLGKQLTSSEQLKTYFSDPILRKAIGDYQTDIVTFAGRTKEASDPTKMVPWVQGFDRIVASRKSLTDQLYRATGIQS